MILNTEIRNYQAEERLRHRCSVSTLINVISEGTNCSRFEAELITKKAEEIFRLGEYSEGRVLQPGQMIWQAIDASEPAGKPLEKCKFKRIVLTVHRISEDREVKSSYGMSGKQIGFPFSLYSFFPYVLTFSIRTAARGPKIIIGSQADSAGYSLDPERFCETNAIRKQAIETSRHSPTDIRTLCGSRFRKKGSPRNSKSMFRIGWVSRTCRAEMISLMLGRATIMAAVSPSTSAKTTLRVGTR